MATMHERKTTCVLGRRAQKKQARPREILEAAFEEFTLRGYAATRLDDIAARVGVTKGTLYVYFENKERLFEAMVTELSQPSVNLERYERALDDAPAIEVMALFLEELYETMGNDRYTREILRFLIAEGQHFQDLIAQHHRTFIMPTKIILAAIVQRGIDRGEFAASAAMYSSEVLLAPLLTLIVTRYILLEDGCDVEDYRRVHLKVIERLMS